MRFGLFGSARCGRGDAEGARGYHDYVETNVEAEALGYHASFLVEHHFTGMGQVSATLALQQWVAAKTSTLRLGTAVLVLPWHNPVLLAEQAATLDQLSGGRLDFGIGKGYRHNEFSGFCMPIEEAEPRFEEGLAVILQAWTSEERFSHFGRFWNFDNILVEPPPLQRPHPPLWMAAGSERSILQVAARGANLLLDQFASPAQIAEHIGFYRRALLALGQPFDPMRVAVARNLFIADSTAEAEEAMAQQRRTHEAMIALSRQPDGGGRSHILSYADGAALTLENALYGTPDQVAAGIGGLRAAGAHYLLFSTGRNGIASLRRFAREVMPAFLT